MKILKKQSRKLMSMLLAFLMVFGCFGALPKKVAAAESDYEIYPKPHLMEYQSGDYDIQQNVNIVYEDGVDEYTKARMNEVLAIKKIDASTSTEIQEGKTNILIGIKGSSGYVDNYALKTYTLQTNNLYDKLDSYLLASDNGTITVLGKDADAAFYGITSLYHIFNQMESNSIRNFVMEDYADVASRGFIEGYYGNPWSTEDRSELMKWGGYYKLNSYFYAPKDDPKHNAKWRELYTDEEIETKIKPLAEAGNESKCRFVFALHPYMNNEIRYNSEENYQNDLKIMQAKFAQVIDAGVRQIAILADDAANVGGDNYKKTLEDMTAWLKEKQKTYPDLKITLPFCAQEYMGNGQTYFKNFPENVQIVMTGGRVWGEVSNSFTTTFTNNTGRGPYLWINWPCTDNSKKHLIMGGYTTFLQPGVDPNKIQGIVLNPMQQSEPSKVAIFGNACYSWNIWETADEADQTWNDSFKYVDHNSSTETPASEALRELSKHMINQNMDSRVTPLQESLNIRDELKEFKDIINSGGNVSDEMIQNLVNEFTVLQKAAVTYRNQAGDTRIRDQIVYWLNCWDDTTEAALAFLNTIKAVQDGADSADIWDKYSIGQAAFERSKTYGFHYVDHTEYAEVGVQHIVPFINTLESNLSTIVSTIVDPSKQVTKFITSRSDTPTGAISNVLDNKASTEIVYKTPNSISEGTYVGVSYTKAIDVNKVIFRLGTAGNAKDTFLKSKVQYTNDGKEWKDLDSTVYDLPNEVVLDNLELKNVKGIRMIATVDKTNTWLGVRDIVVNPVEKPDVEVDNGTLSTDKISVKGGTLANITDKDTSTYAHFAEDPYKAGEIKDYIPVDAKIILTYKNPKKLGIINFTQADGTDKITKYVIEYSEDGSTWKSLGEYTGDAIVNLDVSDQNISAKAVRVRNLELNLKNETTGYWWQVYNFNVSDPAEVKPTFMNTSTWTIYQGSVANLTDGDDNTDVEFNTKPGDITRVGDFIGWDFGKTIQVGKVHAAIGGKRDAGNKWTKYKLEYSVDNVNWTTYKPYTGVASGKDIIDENLRGVEARYIRLVNQEERNKWVIFSEFNVKQFDPNVDFDTANVYTNTDYKLASEYAEDATKLIYNQSITLQKDQFIGVDLTRIKDLKEIDIKTTNSNNLTIQVSKNKVEWHNVSTKELPDARYVRVINLTNNAVTFNLENFVVNSNEVSAPSLYETTLGFEPGWGAAEDTRNNGAAFDGNINTTTEFGTLPQKDQYAIYDLGQERTISKIQMYCQDDAVNYIRDADILISNDLQNWTKVVTIGDGIENKADGSVKCIDSDAGYKASSTYPNKVVAEGTVVPMQARYIKILMTATNNNRAVVFNEIVINDGEYVSTFNDPTFNASAIEVQGFVPQNMFDGDLTTAYKPNTKDAGYITYTLSENLGVKKINIVQKGEASGAKVLALVMVDGTKQWVQVGTLAKSLNEISLPFWDNIYELKFEWEANKVPTISEVIMLTGDEFFIDHSALTDYINGLDIKEDKYTDDSYAKFAAALATANKVNTDNNSTAKELEKALSDLQTAVSELVIIIVNKTSLQIAVDMANEVSAEELDKVVPAVVKEFKAALQEAEELLTNEDVTQKEVNKSFDRLASAMQKLSFFKGDKEALISLVDKIEKLNRDDYISTTLTALDTELIKAKEVIADENAMVEEVNKATDSLTRAFLQLRLKPNKALLGELINQAEKVDANLYTVESYKAVTTALEKAKNVFNIEDVTQEKVDTAAKNLKEALAGLKEVNGVVVPGDTTKPGTTTKPETTTKPASKTGDEATLGLFVGLLAMSGIVAVISKKRKED